MYTLFNPNNLTSLRFQLSQLKTSFYQKLLASNFCVYNIFTFHFQDFNTNVKTTSQTFENYNMVFNLYEGKQYFLFNLPIPIKISLSNLYLNAETWIYMFKNVYAFDTYSAQYFKIFIMFILIFVISNLLFLVASFFSLNTIKDSEKLSQYECGFEPFDEATRHPFDVHFYVVGILFLIFDVEIALLFPWIYSLHILNWLGFYVMILFIIILTIGFFYEWHRGALAWPHKNITEKTLAK